MSTTASHIEALLQTGEVVAPPPGVQSWFPIADQDAWIAQALRDRDGFWRERAAGIAWETPPSEVFRGSIEDPHWFADGRLNATVSCLDRHAAAHPGAVAYDYLCENGATEQVTYADLHARVNRLANALRADRVAAGDRVIVYMPLTIEGIMAMLACARIGAIHSVVYAGLGATALRDRIVDAGASVVFVGDVTYRRGKPVDLKGIVDKAIDGLEQVRRVVVHRREGAPLRDAREVDWAAFTAGQSAECAPEIVNAEHPLFILYTSGTTGKPKGVVMAHGGYLVGASAMLRETTGITPDDAYWCTSDIGWIVGHTMMVYGALANRYRIILREGSPDFPAADAVYAAMASYRVTQFYTAPTLARMLLRLGDAMLEKHDLLSLKAIYCAGEPLNPEAWRFLHEKVGRGRVAVCNQWWQTELAAPTIGFFPTAAIHPDRSGKALGPIAFSIRDANGAPLPADQGGLLVVETPLPYMFASVWNDPERYAQYFRWGVYVAGDVATVDANGYVTVRGRADDVLNVAGHRIATADVESALVSHPACGEAGVCGVPDELKGEAIVAYVVLRAGREHSEALANELIAHVRAELGPIATPSSIRFAAKLPKTRSGKIMRRLLKAQETGQELGDVTTLEE
ncbi:acetate--CoA ligase [Vulcanimicrobium alpinum]|uniref:acetate--CoA ligase n=1 Tax=Vulcanimicrobium alpinum TaxID=3016050 RepID=A0AAN1XUF7_UNVUL|nr:acetate--CoA ligase [Vulcanimicrobium alpinum]BDE05720.1 acetate--CoA ligase [Vulcanimicrobium alpinum]